MCAMPCRGFFANSIYKAIYLLFYSPSVSRRRLMKILWNLGLKTSHPERTAFLWDDLDCSFEAVYVCTLVPHCLLCEYLFFARLCGVISLENGRYSWLGFYSEYSEECLSVLSLMFCFHFYMVQISIV